MQQSVRNLWAILAQSSSIDKDENTMSLFNLIEEVTFNAPAPLPEKTVLVPFNSHLVTMWERDDVGKKFDLKFKIVLRDPNNKILAENEGVVQMGPQHKRYRFRTKIQGMPVTGPGTYRYEVISLEPEKTDNKELVASASFIIKISGPPVKSPITL